MRSWMCFVAAAGLLACAPAWADARVDPLFAAWDKPDSPGAAVAVVQDGRVVFSRGYGQAHLEHPAPITPQTVFHVASLSKQFTAFAVQLLARDGKLSLDDDVRKHVPEMQVEGVRIRHLLHHTSGLRDQWDLLMLAGLRLDDGITEDDILGLLFGQKQLNFAPGSDYLYSNSGYALLGLIVRRVSGQSLASFAREYIFEPLGMKNTHFHEQYGALVKGRAYSYRRTPQGWRYQALSYSNTGATSLFTTVEDLARWDANLDSGQVGGPAVQQAMLATAALADGRPNDYASGLVKGSWRGLPVLAHSGADAAYRAFFMRLPQQRLTVVVLGNASDLAAPRLAREVAHLFLPAGAAQQPPPSPPAEVPLAPNELSPYAGDFQFPQGSVIRFAIEGTQLVAFPAGQFKVTLAPLGDGSFFTRGSDARLKFTAGGAVWQQDGREVPLKRIDRESPPDDALQACAGSYYSEELRTFYTLSLAGGKFMLRFPRGQSELKPVNRNVFAANHPFGTVTLQRNPAGRCESLAVTTGRVRHLKFDRVQILPDR
jgi:CubicO group peptidase (beta-lactamase class C family)